MTPPKVDRSNSIISDRRVTSMPGRFRILTRALYWRQVRSNCAHSSEKIATAICCIRRNRYPGPDCKFSNAILQPIDLARQTHRALLRRIGYAVRTKRRDKPLTYTTRKLGPPRHRQTALHFTRVPQRTPKCQRFDRKTAPSLAVFVRLSPDFLYSTGDSTRVGFSSSQARIPSTIPP